MTMRAFLLGFGVGLIVAAGFLFSFSANPANQQAAPGPDQLRTLAREQNLVLLTREEYEQLRQGNGKETDGAPAKEGDKQQADPVQPTGDKSEESGSEEAKKAADKPVTQAKPADSSATPASRSAQGNAVKGSQQPKGGTPVQAKQTSGTSVAPDGTGNRTPVLPAEAKEVDVPVTKTPRVPEAPLPPEPPGPPESKPGEVSITIPSGWNSSQVADLLLAEGLIGEKNAFLELWQRQNGQAVREGSYRIPVGAPVEEIVRTITAFLER